jgi:hypothetical protein
MAARCSPLEDKPNLLVVTIQGKDYAEATNRNGLSEG